MFLLRPVSLVWVVVLLCSLTLTLLRRVDSHLFQKERNLTKASHGQTAVCLFAIDQERLHPVKPDVSGCYQSLCFSQTVKKGRKLLRIP